MFCVIPFSRADNAAPASSTAQGRKPANQATPTEIQKADSAEFQKSGSSKHATDDPKTVRVIFPAKDKYDYWSLGISALLAIVGLAGIGVGICTLLRIHRQAIEMRLQRVLMQRTLHAMRRQGELMAAQAAHTEKQTVILEKSVAAAETSAEAASLQIQMMKDKERARVEIDRRGLELQQESEEFWNLKATIELRNVGTGRAYVRQGTVNLLMAKRGKERPDPDYWSPLGLVGGFVDPNGEPLTESSYIFREQEFDLGALAQQIYEGTIRLYLTGFIEYDTIGTRFRRDFSYVWIGNGDPESVSGMLLADEPRNDSERVSFGFLRQDQFRPNDECEKEPPKETAKPN